MKHKAALISLVFAGCVFLFAGSAWAGGRDHRHGHFFEKRPHYGYCAPKRQGWHHHRGPQDKRFHHGPRYRGRHHRLDHGTVEKHVYHHYGSGDRYRGDRYHAAGSVWDPGFSFSFGISGSR